MEKNKELTPMMEAIERIESKSKENNSMDFHYGLNHAFRILIELLPKEKQVNEEFWEQGFEIANEVAFETYYNNKYNNQIK